MLEQQPAGKHDAATLAELSKLVQERLRAYLVSQTLDGRAVSSETFEAMRALGIAQPLDFRRLQAAHGFTAHPAAVNLAVANKRMRNILSRLATAPRPSSRAALSAPPKRRFTPSSKKPKR